MLEYSGPTDPTWCGEEILFEELFNAQMWSLTQESDIVLLGRPVKGLNLRNPPLVRITPSELV